jgi:rhamnosyl/mannosyltransferase
MEATLARADRIVLSNNALLEQSVALVPHPAKCAVIPFGVDVAFWSGSDDQARAEADRISANHPRLVIAVGRLVPYKGFDVLIEALTRLEATAIIVGIGQQERRLRRLVERYGLTDRVFFTGTVSRERLRTLLRAARVFALPSLNTKETFGIAQLEAMAAGLPIVNTSVPSGPPSVARHGIEALTVSPGAPRELAEAIGLLLDSPTLAAQLGAGGKARAAEYDQQTFIDRTYALYREAVAARGSAAAVLLPAHALKTA